LDCGFSGSDDVEWYVHGLLKILALSNLDVWIG
jgi:hypothetical protein